MKLPIILYMGNTKKRKENIETVMRRLGYRNFVLVIPEDENKE